MRKRLVRTRKRIKKNIGGGKRERAVCEREDKRVDTDGYDTEGGALIPYERGELEAVVSESEEETAEERETDTVEHRETSVQSTDGSREGILRLVCGFVAVFSLFSAVVITCFAFAVATKYRDEPAEEVVADAPKEDTDREPHTAGAVLSATEIYSKCVDFTVSVSVKYSSELGGGEGIGSGFIISEDGYIATACHVVEGAQSITVTLQGGRAYEARAVASDSMSDIALLKIDGAEGLVAAELGSSSALKAGDTVYAIGTPTALEYAGTMTSGEVSAPERLLSVYRDGVKTLQKKLRVIQMSAEVNRGSSGCPLIDVSGRVVGMVTMRLGTDVRGVGFALPIDGVEAVLSAMKEGRELSESLLSGVVIKPARLGIQCVAAEYNGAYGCRVEATDGAGALKVGDVIVQIDELLVTRPSDIEGLLEGRVPGESVRVTLFRSGQRLSFDIVLGS